MNKGSRGRKGKRLKKGKWSELIWSPPPPSRKIRLNYSFISTKMAVIIKSW